MTISDPTEPPTPRQEAVTEAESWSVHGDLPAQARSVPTARHTIVDLLKRYGTPPALQGKVGLAVTEAATNVVLHAYPHWRTPGRLRYDADIEDDDLEIVISDDGQGLREDYESDGLGLGLQILAGVSDDFSIQSTQAGTEVWLRFILDAHPT